MGRDCLPTTPSDSRTHAQRAHTHREQQSTPFMRLRHASGSTRQHPGLSSEHMQTKHGCAQPMRTGCRASLRPCILACSRAHCLCQMPDLRYLLQEHKQGTGMRMRAGGRAQHCRPCSSTHLPGLRAPEARSRTISCPFGLQFAALAQICAKQGERVEGEFEGSSIGLSSHQYMYRTA